MIRRDFINRLAKTAAGIWLADDALSLLEPRRKYWPGASFAPTELPYFQHGDWLSMTGEKIFVRVWMHEDPGAGARASPAPERAHHSRPDHRRRNPAPHPRQDPRILKILHAPIEQRRELVGGRARGAL